VRSSCCVACSLRGEPPGVARTCSAAAARAVCACVRGMAAPAAEGAAVVQRPILSNDAHSIVATMNMVPRSAVEYEWKLTGVTKELFTEAAVGEYLVSPLFSALGFAWRLELFPNGEEAKDAGEVGLYLSLRTENVTLDPVVTLSAGVAPKLVLRTDRVSTPVRRVLRAPSVTGARARCCHGLRCLRTSTRTRLAAC
jgi:hypothetical protein